MAKDKIMLDLFERNLQNLYNSEKLILKSLPQMSEYIVDEALKEVVKNFTDDTDRQKKRLENIGEFLNIKLAVKDGNIIRALLDDIQWLYNEFPKGVLMDIGIVSKLQHIQHFQISAYETALLYSKSLHIHEISKILDKTLEEAYEGDEFCSHHAKRLTKKAKVKDRNG